MMKIVFSIFLLVFEVASEENPTQATTIDLDIPVTSPQQSSASTPESSLSLYSMRSVSRESLCDNILPGLNLITRGIDLTRLDLAHDYVIDDKDGFTENLFDFTCRKHRKIQIDGKNYDIPDQILAIKQNEFDPETFEDLPVHLFDDWRKLKDHFARALGLGESALKGWFSESGSMSYYQKILVNSTSLVMMAEASVPVLTVTMSPRGALRRSLNDVMSDYLSKDLPNSYEDDPERYLDFLRSYGTHYFKSGTLGGSIKFWTQVAKYPLRNRTSEYLIKNAKSVYYNVLENRGAPSDPSFRNTSSDEIFQKHSKSSYRPFGGEESLLETDGFMSWKESLLEKPFIIDGRLESITTLIREEGKRIQMQKALSIYTGLSYLEESKRVLDSYLVILPQKVKENIQFLMKRIDAFQQLDVPNWETLKKIMDEL
ncbi:perivitellin-2 67 kDa subunit-like [Brevipalpus obovatus]|uniref:perivitellin-2 67 kDa subunit-like n=1 Tax=Brevipalpus obovatus TaxID=246614 RepID=UPI003D9F68A6